MSQIDEEVDTNVLLLHNHERGLYGIASLSLSHALSEDCLNWAKRGLNDNKFEHAKGIKQGENIAWRTDDKSLTDTQISTLLFDQWQNEGQNFTNEREFPNNSRNGRDVSHYTQIMWRKSGQLGVGLARNGKWAYLVCRYTPQGNIVGEKVF